MPYIIKARDLYLKRTSQFGYFHGRMIFTTDINDARRFTHKTHAEKKGSAIAYRMEKYKHDINKPVNESIVGIKREEIQIIEYPPSGRKE